MAIAVQFAMMLKAQPSNLEGFSVIVVVSFGFWSAAYLAGLANESTIAKRIADCHVGGAFNRISASKCFAP
ncbi:MAG TPA: hypothetical protein VEH27_00765 [Methylomirabilota bacterium]|nr:hypothetical protein [Methylomirabilota bacterium]